jgi:hypothetical protein
MIAVLALCFNVYLFHVLSTVNVQTSNFLFL